MIADETCPNQESKLPWRGRTLGEILFKKIR